MKLLVIAFVAVAIAVVSAESSDGHYTTKFDSIDLDEILSSKRLLKSYVNCLMDRGSCTPDGKELKNILPDAIATGCEKCNEKQKAGAEKIIHHLVDKQAETWKELADKYDPDKKYRVKWEGKAKEYGITV